MAEYTIQELQEMLHNQIETETSQSAILSDLEIFIDNVSSAEDLETTPILINNIIVGNVLKSNSLNKQCIEQRHYIEELEKGEIVSRAVSYVTYITGSYLDTLPKPTMQVIGTRQKDRSVLKGQ
jgi:hypothetical protein